MTKPNPSLAGLSDRELLTRVCDAAQQERRVTAALIALLAELDARRLYLGEGCSSLFTYCTQVLHLSEHAAYNRIEAARAARRFPVILDLIESAAVTPTTVRLIAPHLTSGDHCDVLERARHKRKREIELLIATLNPRPDEPSIVRKLPAPATPVIVGAAPQQSTAAGIAVPTDIRTFSAPAPRPAAITPLAPERYKIQFTVSRETYERLRRVQDLLRHTVANGDPAIVFERALGLLLERLERTRTAKTTRPRAGAKSKQDSRHIPAAVKRAVWERDNGCCAFRGSRGRCTETGFLEYHHVVPFAEGGKTALDNLELRCRAHNQYEAELWFGTSMSREARATLGA